MPWTSLQRVRTDAPLVHNITNYVVMNQTANALLAVGASPVMAHAIEEVDDMVGLARALVINMGTLSSAWVDAMVSAGRAASARGIPIVFDPVGCGATSYRTATAMRIMDEVHPTIVRGNASEILALAGGDASTKGVDSSRTTDSVTDAVAWLAAARRCTVSVSGTDDLIVGDGQVARVHNGHPMMPSITGMGCTASAITGAFAAVNGSAFLAAVQAMTVMGVCGEIAAAQSRGPGSFVPAFIDALWLLDKATLEGAARVTMSGA